MRPRQPKSPTDRSPAPFHGRPGPLHSRPTALPDNAQIAEWLALAAEETTGHWQRALRRASRAAFLWPIEVRELIAEGRPLTELRAVGPATERLLTEWFKNPPSVVSPPALRRSFLTLTQARKILEADPSWARRYQGDLQMHSVWSDGAGTIAAMAEAAAQRGYKYIAITDHSKGLKIAGGLDEAELRAQGAEIKSLRTDVQVLRSIEVNLSPSGAVDMEAEALAELDLVVGSFHSALRVKGDQTERYLAALRNPHVQILGHPRGRIYNFRIGLEANWERVFEEAARLDKAIEVDSYPDRQDIDGELLVLARKASVRIAIDTDGHAPEQLHFAELGLATALQAGVEPGRIVNFMPQADLLRWSGQLRGKEAPRRRRSSRTRVLS